MRAGMNYAKTGKVQPDWQASKPANGILVVARIFFELVKKFCVLARIFFRMVPQETSVSVLCCPADGVEFVISHYRSCCARFTHGARNSQNLPLPRSAIYKIANEDHLLFWMLENTFDFGVVAFA